MFAVRRQLFLRSTQILHHPQHGLVTRDVNPWAKHGLRVYVQCVDDVTIPGHEAEEDFTGGGYGTQRQLAQVIDGLAEAATGVFIFNL
jgi:hypothetical protein